MNCTFFIKFKNKTCIVFFMSTYPLYCQNCKKDYNVREEDLQLMKKHDKSFDGKEYKKGCFFKELNKIKREIKNKEESVV